MSLQIAVDRLYETGWTPAAGEETESAPDGRVFPGLLSIQRTFFAAGLELAIKHNLVFNCYRATWYPIGQPLEGWATADATHGTVVGQTDVEAAVYALAQLRQSARRCRAA
jgi:hypothetical protein